MLSELLPNINGRVSETRQTINLAAFGFGSGTDSPFGNIPLVIGPFNVFDARIFLSQSVLDFGAINSSRAETHNVEAAELTFKSARDHVVHVAGNLFVRPWPPPRAPTPRAPSRRRRGPCTSRRST